MHSHSRFLRVVRPGEYAPLPSSSVRSRIGVVMVVRVLLAIAGVALVIATGRWTPVLFLAAVCVLSHREPEGRTHEAPVPARARLRLVATDRSAGSHG